MAENRTSENLPPVSGIAPRRSGRPAVLKHRGYFGFRLMADLHNALWPGKDVDGNSRIAHKIYRALDRAYTDGFEDAIQLDETHLARARRRICGREQDI